MCRCIPQWKSELVILPVSVIHDVPYPVRVNVHVVAAGDIILPTPNIMVIGFRHLLSLSYIDAKFLLSRL